MRNKASLILLILIEVSSAQDSVSDIVKRSMDARNKLIESLKLGVVRVEAPENTNGQTGVGIVISSSPQEIQILTALHVVTNEKGEEIPVNVVFYSNQTRPVKAEKLKKQSDSLDLAVLAVKSVPDHSPVEGFPGFQFAMSSNLQQGTHVWTWNGDWVMVPNTVTEVDQPGEVAKFLYTNTGGVGVGFSGGPVFDDYANLIGIHDAGAGDKLGKIGLAIKIDAAFKTLKSLGYTVPKLGPGFLSTLGQPTQAAAAKPMRISQLTVNGTFQPVGGESGQMLVTLTPNAGGSTYTARLRGGFGATFVNGTANENEQTFTFKTLQTGMSIMPLGDKYLNVTGGSLSLAINQTRSATGVALGNVSGSMNFVGTAATREQLAAKRRGYGRAAPTDDTPVMVSG